MTDEQIVAAAKAAGQKTEFGELVRSPLVRGTFSAYEIGFIEGAEWAREQMPMPEDTVLFQKGVEEGRRLEREDMLKDAEEEPDFPGFEEDKDMVVGRDYVPVDWVETLDLYGRWKIIPMKDAVEGEVIKTNKHTSVRYKSYYGTDRYFYGIADKQFKAGDKVRIIILPEEDGE